MDTRPNVAGHPLHPMLVAFPVALFTATIAAELAHIGTHDPFYFRAAMVANLGGIVTARLAAIPGAIDLFSLPVDSPARSAWLKQAGLNLLTVGLFVVSGAILYDRWTTTLDPFTLDAHIPLAFDVVGLVAMVSAGALAWTLVQTSRVGVKPGSDVPADFHHRLTP